MRNIICGEKYGGRRVIQVDSLPNHAGEPSWVICCKGTHGAGKTTTATEMLAKDPDHVFVTANAEACKPCATYSPKYDVLLIGTYLPGRNCGGCDSLRDTQTVKDIVARLWRKQAHILFEGIIVASIKVPFFTFLTEMSSSYPRKVSFCFLNTELSECLRRIQQRNGGKPINERIVASKHRYIARHRDFYEAHGVYCTTLDTTGTPAAALERFLRLYPLQRIDRVPVNSGGPSMPEVPQDKFNEERLEQLIDKWDQKVDAFWKTDEECCEIVCEVWKETAKAGCQGGFSAALRRMKLPASTAYEMVARHRIRIGELPDPDAFDPRDTIDDGDDTQSTEESAENGEAEPGEEAVGNKRGKPPVRDPKVTLTMKGLLATAVATLQQFYRYADARTAVRETVLRAYRQLTTPSEHEPTKFTEEEHGGDADAGHENDSRAA